MPDCKREASARSGTPLSVHRKYGPHLSYSPLIEGIPEPPLPSRLQSGMTPVVERALPRT